MRPFIAFILVFFNLSLAEAQVNLVPNPSFEDTISCPIFLDQLNECSDWSSYRGSPDYFNSCGSMGLSVPNTTFGYQYAHSGEAFVGLVTYHKNNTAAGGNYREYAGVSLNTPLQVGSKYYFSFYAVLAETYTGFASNNLGLRFFTNAYSVNTPAPNDNFSHLHIDTILNDSINWHKISGSFVADSNYQYVSIGNFYDYSNTDSLIINTFSPAYYFIDDICVSTDSVYNETWTSIQTIYTPQLSLWPNPIVDLLNFQCNHQIKEVEIYDNIGRLLKILQINLGNNNIELSELNPGIYFAVFRFENNLSVHKFIKI